MYIRNCWYVAGWSNELPAQGMISRVIINEPLVLFRTADGRVIALEDRCCHRQAPLSLGRREGDHLRCMYHGLKFDSTGRCVEIPGQQTIPPTARVRRFAAVEKDSWLWIWMGEERAADESLIPPAVGLDDPNWSLRSGSLACQASHTLLHDNLCDLSHIAFLHETSFGYGQDHLAKSLPRIATTPRGIRVDRWSTATVPPEGGLDLGADHYLKYDYYVPGVLILRFESYPPGTASRFEFGEPKADPLHASCTSQAVTAVTDTSSQYYFSWGPRACEAAVHPELPDALFTLANRAFEEDRCMLEAQQRNLELRSERDPLMIAHDRGPTLMRSVFERLVREEQAIGSPRLPPRPGRSLLPGGGLIPSRVPTR
jgi:vanillate O-demethylase monooxygenase subunit